MSDETCSWVACCKRSRPHAADARLAVRGHTQALAQRHASWRLLNVALDRGAGVQPHVNADKLALICCCSGGNQHFDAGCLQAQRY